MQYCIKCVLNHDLKLDIKPIKDINKNKKTFYDLENENVELSRMLQMEYPTARITEIFNAVVVAVINARRSGLIDTYPELLADNTTTKKNLHAWFEKNYINSTGRHLLCKVLNCTAEQVDRVLNQFRPQLIKHP